MRRTDDHKYFDPRKEDDYKERFGDTDVQAVQRWNDVMGFRLEKIPIDEIEKLSMSRIQESLYDKSVHRIAEMLAIMHPDHNYMAYCETLVTMDAFRFGRSLIGQQQTWQKIKELDAHLWRTQ